MLFTTMTSLKKKEDITWQHIQMPDIWLIKNKPTRRKSLLLNPLSGFKRKACLLRMQKKKKKNFL